MRYQLTVFTLILASAVVVLAAPSDIFARQDDCEAAYNICLASSTPEVACQCTLASCSGEDDARDRAFCATATAATALAAQSTGFTSLCNAAAIARGDCTASAAIVSSRTYVTASIVASSTCTTASSTIEVKNATTAAVPSAYTTTAAPPVYTGVADRTKPAMAFLAFGALVLL